MYRLIRSGLASVVLVILPAKLLIAQAARESAEQGTPHLVEGRFEVDAPKTPLLLLSESRIQIKLLTPGLMSLMVTQSVVSSASLLPREVAESFQEDSIHTAPDHSQYISLKPLRLGEVVVTVLGFYPGRAIQRSTIRINVVPTTDKPVEFGVGQMGSPTFDSGTASLSLSGKKRFEVLAPFARYFSHPNEIPIWASFVTFSITTANEQPVIALDERSGKITPLRTGHVLVKTSFGGLDQFTCVTVNETDETVGPRRSSCEDLLPANQHLGKVRQEN